MNPQQQQANRSEPPAEVLYARIGRLSVELDAVRNMLAATQRALKEADEELKRLREPKPNQE